MPADPSEPQIGSGYIVLALGKMGGIELNYSSDIDLIVFYDPDVPALPADIEPGPMFVRLTQRLVKLLQERTVDGYVFRTDLRLRPDPSSTPIAVSKAAALSYYESVGQNWERAAMIKARACAGDIAAGEALLSDLSPFVWRKYLDFAAVADVQAMKRQINAYRGHGEIAVEGHNIKIGRGGIREVEFFAQTQQLIAGGRDPSLRDRDTLTTLDKLAEDRWIEEDARDDMKAAYCFLRKVEHRLQMVHDEQTQALPGDREGLERFARFLGFPDRDAFAAVLVGHLDKVQRYYAQLFETEPGADRPALNFPADADDHKTLDRLAELGFSAPLETSGIVRHWLAGDYRSLKGEVARQNLQALLPLLLEQLARSDNPERRAAAVRPFPLQPARRRPAAVVAAAEPGTDLAHHLGARHRAAARRHRRALPAGDGRAGRSELLRPLAERRGAGQAARRGAGASRATDEDLLERVRMFGQEYMFLIGVRILSGTLTARQAGEAFARLADAVIRAVHRAVADNFAERHGHMHGEETAVLAMGKLGGREMTATSDLDLILMYDFDEEHPESEGERPLYGVAIFRAADPAADQRADGADQSTARSIRSTCACARPAAPARWRRRSRASPAIRRPRPGPGSTWR